MRSSNSIQIQPVNFRWLTIAACNDACNIGSMNLILNAPYAWRGLRWNADNCELRESSLPLSSLSYNLLPPSLLYEGHFISWNSWSNSCLLANPGKLPMSSHMLCLMLIWVQLKHMEYCIDALVNVAIQCYYILNHQNKSMHTNLRFATKRASLIRYEWRSVMEWLLDQNQIILELLSCWNYLAYFYIKIHNCENTHHFILCGKCLVSFVH